MAGMDEIFKALADPVRREILDRLHDKPGLNVNQLSENFEMTRFGVMKHLKLLEDANLVVSRKEWKEKKLYLNAVPIELLSSLVDEIYPAIATFTPSSNLKLTSMTSASS